MNQGIGVSSFEQVQEFIIALSEDALCALYEDRRVVAAEVKSNTKVIVTRRLLNRRHHGNSWMKFIVIQIYGPSVLAISQCSCMITKNVPALRDLKAYGRQASIKVIGSEFIPDNTNLYFEGQRMKKTTAYFGGLLLNSPFQEDPSRPMHSKPWKCGSNEILGTTTPDLDYKDKIAQHYLGIQTSGDAESEPKHDMKKMLSSFNKFSNKCQQQGNMPKRWQDVIMNEFPDNSRAANSGSYGVGVEKRGTYKFTKNDLSSDHKPQSTNDDNYSSCLWSNGNQTNRSSQKVFPQNIINNINETRKHNRRQSFTFRDTFQPQRFTLNRRYGIRRLRSLSCSPRKKSDTLANSNSTNFLEKGSLYKDESKKSPTRKKKEVRIASQADSEASSSRSQKENDYSHENDAKNLQHDQMQQNPVMPSPKQPLKNENLQNILDQVETVVQRSLQKIMNKVLLQSTTLHGKGVTSLQGSPFPEITPYSCRSITADSSKQFQNSGSRISELSSEETRGKSNCRRDEVLIELSKTDSNDSAQHRYHDDQTSSLVNDECPSSDCHFNSSTNSSSPNCPNSQQCRCHEQQNGRQEPESKSNLQGPHTDGLKGPMDSYKCNAVPVYNNGIQKQSEGFTQYANIPDNWECNIPHGNNTSHDAVECLRSTMQKFGMLQPGNCNDACTCDAQYQITDSDIQNNRFNRINIDNLTAYLQQSLLRDCQTETSPYPQQTIYSNTHHFTSNPSSQDVLTDCQYEIPVYSPYYQNTPIQQNVLSDQSFHTYYQPHNLNGDEPKKPLDNQKYNMSHFSFHDMYSLQPDDSLYRYQYEGTDIPPSNLTTPQTFDEHSDGLDNTFSPLQESSQSFLKTCVPQTNQSTSAYEILQQSQEHQGSTLNAMNQPFSLEQSHLNSQYFANDVQSPDLQASQSKYSDPALTMHELFLRSQMAFTGSQQRDRDMLGQNGISQKVAFHETHFLNQHNTIDSPSTENIREPDNNYTVEVDESTSISKDEYSSES